MTVIRLMVGMVPSLTLSSHAGEEMHISMMMNPGYLASITIILVSYFMYYMYYILY